jgi:hypothetical protein
MHLIFAPGVHPDAFGRGVPTPCVGKPGSCPSRQTQINCGRLSQQYQRHRAEINSWIRRCEPAGRPPLVASATKSTREKHLRAVVYHRGFLFVCTLCFLRLLPNFGLQLSQWGCSSSHRHSSCHSGWRHWKYWLFAVGLARMSAYRTDI